MTSARLPHHRPLLSYFLLAFLISWGGVFIVLATTNFDLSPLKSFEGGLIFLAMLLGPSLSGLFFTMRLEGWPGLRQLAARLVRWRVGTRWYLVALLTIPAILLAILWLSSALIAPSFAPRFQWMLFAVGLIAGSFEEIGWTGFATPRLCARLPIDMAGLMLGLIWAFWHLIVDLRYNFGSMGAVWPLEFAVVYLGTLTPYRMLMMWVYSHTRSLFLSILMHASFTGWLMVLLPSTSTWQSLGWQAGFALILWTLVAGVFVRLGRPRVISAKRMEGLQ